MCIKTTPGIFIFNKIDMHICIHMLTHTYILAILITVSEVQMTSQCISGWIIRQASGQWANTVPRTSQYR